MGKFIEFFSNFADIMGLMVGKFYAYSSLVFVAAAITFVALSKSQKVQQRAFKRKVKKIKEKQSAYKHELNQEKMQAHIKDYNKAIKSLRRRIRYALFWNKKKIVLSDKYLLKTDSKADLSINGTPFTFRDILNEEIAKKCKGKKKSTQVIEQGPVVRTSLKRENAHQTLNQSNAQTNARVESRPNVRTLQSTENSRSLDQIETSANNQSLGGGIFSNNDELVK